VAAEDGVAIGAQGDAEVVSFHALKTVSAGERDRATRPRRLLGNRVQLGLDAARIGRRTG
jgi:hypothetical protein